MAGFLEKYKGQFQTFDHKECLNILLMHIRQGNKYEFLMLIVQRMTGRKLTADAFSLMMRRVLFILVGKNKDGYDESYHKRFSGKKIYSSVGQYYDTHINFDTDNYKIYRNSGASTLAKSLTMTKDHLIDVIEACEGGDPVAIVDYMESNFSMADMYITADATYVCILF